MLLVLVASVSGCSPSPLDELELLAGIEDFDRAIQGQPRESVQQLLREHARTYKGRVVEVRSAVIASPYIRENPSHVYFGVNYDQNDHLFLSDIDPALHELLVEHSDWVSVVKTDALIRGKSVYCSPVELRITH
jgi:hypothetical protein